MGLAPGPKIQKMGGAGVQWAPKWGKSPRSKFLSFGPYFFFDLGFWEVCGWVGLSLIFLFFKKSLCVSVCVRPSRRGSAL